MQEATVSEQPTTLNLDLDRLTIGDLEDFQEVTGRDLLDVVTSDGAGGDVKVLKAVLWIARRQEDPSVTLESIRDVKVADLMAANEALPDEAEDDTNEVADPS